MELPYSALDILTPRQFFLLATLYRHVDRWGEVDLSMEKLGELTGASRTTLWRDMTALEDNGLVDTRRTKRNFGKLHNNRYRLISPGFTAETSEVDKATEEDLLCFQPETSTAGQGSSNSYKTISLTTKSLVSNTSYYLEGGALERKKSMVNRWSDDDDIGGFGLLEGEVPSAQKSAPVSKRDPKTRHQRPQEEWTPVDVATEFAARAYAKVPGVPGMVNTRALWGALAANRKKFNITAVIELEVLEKFFGDERNITALKKAPKSAHGMFLNAITNFVASVTQDLGLEDAPVKIKAQPSSKDFIYASDGTEFDNSMFGRVELAEYEKSLK